MFLDEQLQNLTRRIKNIEQNPRPDFLQSNKLRYQIELEYFQSTIEAWKAGKPFAILEGVEPLTQALGFQPQGYIEWGDRVRAPERYQELAVNKFGFPDHTCDRTVTALGLLLSGEVPAPRLMCSRRIPCDPERWSAQAAAKYTGVLFYEIVRQNSNGIDNVTSLAEQTGELIEFAQKSVPGAKYDESKLIELLDMDQQAINYFKQTYELPKRVPCPISPQDSFRLVTMPSRYPNPAKVVEWAKMYRDELYERAEKGSSGVQDEKLRIAWLATGPYGRSTFDMLSRKGIALPWFHYGVAPPSFGLVPSNINDDSIYGRKLNTLEKLISLRHWNTNVWSGPEGMWVSTLVKACRDLKIDAVVDFLQIGCIPTKNLKRITGQRLREELGIPTLDLEGREFFANEASTLEMNRKLEDFLDTCIARKNN